MVYKICFHRRVKSRRYTLGATTEQTRQAVVDASADQAMDGEGNDTSESGGAGGAGGAHRAQLQPRLREHAQPLWPSPPTFSLFSPPPAEPRGKGGTGGAGGAGARAGGAGGAGGAAVLGKLNESSIADSESMDDDEVDGWVEEAAAGVGGPEEASLMDVSAVSLDTGFGGFGATDDADKAAEEEAALGRYTTAATTPPFIVAAATVSSPAELTPRQTTPVDDDGGAATDGGDMTTPDNQSNPPIDDSASKLFSVNVGSPLVSPCYVGGAIVAANEAARAARFAASMSAPESTARSAPSRAASLERPDLDPIPAGAGMTDVTADDAPVAMRVDGVDNDVSRRDDAAATGTPPTPLPRHDAVIPSNIARRAAKRQARALARAVSGGSRPGGQTGGGRPGSGSGAGAGKEDEPEHDSNSGSAPANIASVATDLMKLTAAVRVQSFARGCLARSEVARKRATLRAAAIRHEERLETAAAVMIQAATRGHQERVRAKALRQRSPHGWRGMAASGVTAGQRWHLGQWQQVAAIEAELVALRQVAVEAAAAGVVSNAPEVRGHWRRGGVDPVSTSYAFPSPATAATSSGRRYAGAGAGGRDGGVNAGNNRASRDATTTPSTNPPHPTPSHPVASTGTPAGVRRVRTVTPASTSTAVRSGGGGGVSPAWGSMSVATSLWDGSSPTNSSSSEDGGGGGRGGGTAAANARRLARRRWDRDNPPSVSSISPGSRIVAAAEDLARRYHENPMWGGGDDEYSAHLQAAAASVAAKRGARLGSATAAAAGASPGGSSSAASWSPSVRGLVKSPRGGDAHRGSAEGAVMDTTSSRLPRSFVFTPSPDAVTRHERHAGASASRGYPVHDNPLWQESEEGLSETTTAARLGDDADYGDVPVVPEDVPGLGGESRSPSRHGVNGEQENNVANANANDFRNGPSSGRVGGGRRRSGAVGHGGGKRPPDFPTGERHPRAQRRFGAFTWAAALAVGRAVQGESS